MNYNLIWSLYDFIWLERYSPFSSLSLFMFMQIPAHSQSQSSLLYSIHSYFNRTKCTVRLRGDDLIHVPFFKKYSLLVNERKFLFISSPIVECDKGHGGKKSKSSDFVLIDCVGIFPSKSLSKKMCDTALTSSLSFVIVTWNKIYLLELLFQRKTHFILDRQRSLVILANEINIFALQQHIEQTNETN